MWILFNILLKISMLLWFLLDVLTCDRFIMKLLRLGADILSRLDQRVKKKLKDKNQYIRFSDNISGRISGLFSGVSFIFSGYPGDRYNDLLFNRIMLV